MKWRIRLERLDYNNNIKYQSEYELTDDMIKELKYRFESDPDPLIEAFKHQLQEMKTHIAQNQ